MINASVAIYLAFALLWLPYLAWKSTRRIGRSGPISIARRRFFSQVIGTQVFLLFVGGAMAYRNGIDVLRMPQQPLAAWSAAVLFLALILVTLRLRWSSRTPQDKLRLYSMLPHDSGELSLYAVVALSAGVAEEIAYRGVLTTLLTSVTGSLVIATVISAAAFAYVHLVQGWRAVFAIFIIALIAQAVVELGHSLIPMMAVHAAYDLLAGIIVPRWYESASATTPIDAAPAPGQ